MNKEITKAIIVVIIMCAVLLPIMFYLYPRSAIGNPLCDQMSEQGYYETEWDTAGHETCIDNYKKGADECNGVQKFMGIDPNECYTGKINQTCMDERFEWDSKNITSYGFHCVWGGPGYWAFVGAMAIPFMLLGIFIMMGQVIWTEHKKNREVAPFLNM